MTQRERELRAQIKQKHQEAEQLLNDGKLEEARAVRDDLKKLNDQLDLMNELREMQPPGETLPTSASELPGGAAERADDKANTEYRDAFVQLLRNPNGLTSEQRALLAEKRAMSSKTGEDGGFLIPPDIQTQIYELKRQYVSLENFVTVIPVTTSTGSRVLEKYADITPFAEIGDENTKLADLDNPKVSQISFSIKDYGGIMTLPNNLLNDSPENIMAFVAKWIARKEIITDNSLILNIVKTFPTMDLQDTDDMKHVLNVDLDPMLEVNAIIITNQDGFNYLDTLKDSMGRYILQPDPTQPNVKMFQGKRVVVMANRLLPTRVTTDATPLRKAPVIIGDLQEAVVMFDRQELSLLATSIGGGAFETNTTKLRVIDREDVKKWDDGALVYGEITVPA